MHPAIEAIVTVFTAIIGVAILSIIVSPKAKTSQVIQAAASGFSNSLATAMTPVTGYPMNINTSYPDQGGFGSLAALPSLMG